MIRQAQKMVRDGTVGTVRLVQVQHAQGRHTHQPKPGQPNPWRLDPAVSTEASVIYDLGTHAHHLLRFVTGLEVEQVSAEMTTHVPERKIFDNAFATLRLSNGARGTLWASMIAAGNEHGLAIRLYGEEGSLEWRHEDAAHLVWQTLDGTERILSAAQPGISDEAAAASRLFWGHPEGFFECFANLYREIADAIEAHREGRQIANHTFPSVWDGVLGVRFVDAVLESNRNDGAWIDATVE
jgi:predicted dehydrogenase